MSELPPPLTLGPVAARVVARATAFPRGEVETEPLLARLTPGLSDARRAALLEHVRGDVGVERRAFVAPGERALDLAVAAAREALARAHDDGQSPLRIAAHVHATSTPSRWTGAESARIGQALGLDAPFFDLRSGCTAGLWALREGARLAAETGHAVLVTAADAFSLTFAEGERMLPLAMGDGAAAYVLAASDEPGRGIVRAVFGGDPRQADLATVHAELPGAGPFALGGDPAAFGAAAEAALGHALRALDPDPEATVIVHTGRAAVARRVHPAARTESLARHGNMGAGSALVAWAELAPAERRSVALVSAGGGLSYGALWWRE